MTRVTPQLTPGFDSAWPVDNEWSGNPPLVNPGLVPSERRVGDGGRAGPKAQMRPRRACRCGRVVTVVPNHDLGAGPVVRQEYDQRIVEDLHLSKLSQHAADFTIHPVHHRRMNGHLVRLKSA